MKATKPFALWCQLVICQNLLHEIFKYQQRHGELVRFVGSMWPSRVLKQSFNYILYTLHATCPASWQHIALKNWCGILCVLLGKVEHKIRIDKALCLIGKVSVSKLIYVENISNDLHLPNGIKVYHQLCRTWLK